MSAEPPEPPQPRQRPPTPREPMPSGSLLQTGGRLAEGIVGGLKEQPAMILILVLNAAFLALVHLGVQSTGERHHQEMVGLTQLLEKCFIEKTR